MRLNASAGVVQTLFPGAISTDSIGTILVVSGVLIGMEVLIFLFALVRRLVGRDRTLLGSIVVAGTIDVLPLSCMAAFGGCAMACFWVHDGRMSSIDGVVAFLLFSLGSFLWECKQHPGEWNAPPSSRPK